jgi:hypothetical protein
MNVFSSAAYISFNALENISGQYMNTMHYFMFEFPCVISLYYINNQQDAALAVLFISNCKITTCFGCFLHPSSGVLKTVVAATGACHGSG